MNMKVERSTVHQVKERFKINKLKIETKQKDYLLESRIKEAKEEEERYKEHRKEQRKDRKRKHEPEELESESFDDLKAIMGFSGFGTSKK